MNGYARALQISLVWMVVGGMALGVPLGHFLPSCCNQCGIEGDAYKGREEHDQVIGYSVKLKILHILHSLQVGGLENGVVNLINRLDPERFEHAICCIQSSGPMAERLVWPVEIHVIGGTGTG